LLVTGLNLVYNTVEGKTTLYLTSVAAEAVGDGGGGLKDLLAAEGSA